MQRTPPGKYNRFIKKSVTTEQAACLSKLADIQYTLPCPMSHGDINNIHSSLKLYTFGLCCC